MTASVLALTPPDAGWMRQARCAGRWDVMQSAEDGDVPMAKAFCRACPVRSECLAWTLSLPPRGDVEGVAGGLTREERDLARRRIRRARMPAPPATKCCPRCREDKPLGQFYLRPDRAGGRDTYCRSCCVDLARERRAAKKVMAS